MIGIFDSGLGGLTILKAFLRKLPEYDYTYLGDNARAPYGDKSQNLIYQYTKEAIDFLFKKGCQLVIIACNTASAKALRKIQQEWLPKYYPDRRVLGVVIPAVQAATEIIKKNLRKNKLGIIGTRSTIESGVYEKELAKIGLKIEIFKQPCPLLVPLVEEGWIKRQETKMVLRYYLGELKKQALRQARGRINLLILACTHYLILLKQIERVMGTQCRVLDSPKFTAEKLADYLNRHPEIETKLSKNKTRLFYTTDDEKRFKDLGQRFLGEEIGEAEKIDLK